LIHGAAGGVGSLAVQFACWKGAEVLATCSAANVDFVRALGAHTVVDYQSARFEDVVHAVDVVLDTVGGDVQERSWLTLRPGGILVSVVAPPAPEKAAQHGVRATIVGAQQSSALLRQVGQLIDEGLVKPAVGHTFRLAEARQAHELSQLVHGRGRIVLQVAGE
jgi:NADPH:quinone reductase-like Zn-dependent oxidoreductase